MSCSMPEKFDILFRYLRPTTSVERGCRRSEGDTFVPPLNIFFNIRQVFLSTTVENAKTTAAHLHRDTFSFHFSFFFSKNF